MAARKAAPAASSFLDSAWALRRASSSAFACALMSRESFLSSERS